MAAESKHVEIVDREKVQMRKTFFNKLRTEKLNKKMFTLRNLDMAVGCWYKYMFIMLTTT